MKREFWCLPDGVDELLPPQAWKLEQIRRQVLDLFHAWGFDYIEPPLIEYLDALLVAGDRDLDLQTLKVVDQRSGRLLGVRADMTSQAARIDASRLGSEGVTRLCYAGPVVHANPPAVLESRVPVKAGAEIFGAAGLDADAEVIALMVEVLRTVGVGHLNRGQYPCPLEPVIVLGHMGIYHALVQSLNLDDRDKRALFAAVQSKAEADIAHLVGTCAQADLLMALPRLMGREAALDEARRVLEQAPCEARQAIDALDRLAMLVADRCPNVELRFDLAELAGFGYHNGPVFAAFYGDHGRALARGGRYDGIGAPFGRARPATGFDVNLNRLLETE